MSKILIKNGKIVNEGRIEEKEILFENEMISKIDVSIDDSGAKVIDANGAYVIPGMIDDQVHFREPGLTHKGDFYHEARAAAAGGTTTVMEMPNTKPLAITREAIESKFDMAAEKSMTNFSFYFGASNDNLDEIKQLDPNSVCGIKIFMGASTGNMLVDNEETLNGIFANAKVLVATHCEDTPTIIENEKIYQEKYGEDIPFKYHPDIRSEEACYKSSELAVSLAKKHGTKLHVLHLTTAKELNHFYAGDIDDKQITVEACVHHLFFNDEDYDKLGSLIKCNPAVKRESDRVALRQAVLDDVIDIIATDHAPHTWEEKQNKYMKAPSGLPLVQHALNMLYDLDIPIETIVKKTSNDVARRFQIEKRGFLKEGYYADITILDPNQNTVVKKEDVLYKCGWSPIENYTLKSKIMHTFINGNHVFNDGVLDNSSRGKRLTFERK